MAIYTGVNVLLIFFFFPETQCYRSPNPTSKVDETSSTPSTEEKAEASETAIPAPPSKKSYLRELDPYSGINPGIEKKTSFISLFIRPWPLAVYPAAIYAFLVFSVNLACLLNVVNTAAEVFQSPPYLMSPGVQSLIYIPGLIGGILGGYCGGGLTDLIIQWQTRKNNGIFEPEYRLVALVIPLFIVPAGELMYALNSLC